MSRIKAIGFDLGDTLVEYEGLPLSWEAHYPEALANLAAHLQLSPDRQQIEAACAVLRRYNTRLNPRPQEVAFAAIAREVLACLGWNSASDELACATAFFRPFRQRLRCFPETRATLTRLRARGLQIGVFTDVPYGMPRALVVDDLADTSLTEFIDVLVTSREVGYRKPAAQALRGLGDKLSCGPEAMVYVGNERKDIDAARAFGCEAVLLDRGQLSPAWGQDRTIRSLAEL